MAYYPKSQVKTNLYANLGEYLIASTGEPYQGPYWKNSKNEFFTGKTPSDVPFQQLTPTFDPINDFKSPVPQNPISEVVTTDVGYILSKGINLGNISNYQALPNYISNPPTEQDYQNGEFRRYFCKKTNEILYLEIDQTTYDNLVGKNSQYLWQLYLPFNLPWQITGNKEQVARTNKNIVELTSKRLQLPKFGDYLNNNYLKYYK
jgi:hypothetical protein